MGSNYRAIPSVDKLLSCPEIKQISSGISHEYLLDIVRECLSDIRKRIASGESPLEAESITEMVLNRVNLMFRPTLVPVINATGVILHTNLGRAPLSTETVKAMSEVAGSYSSLEVDLSSGRRGSRQEHVENILCRLTGAEAAMAVNNNAGAVMLALSALARRREVIVSRGQAVEIGGGFRIPDVMRQSGAKLVEVGTTNRTRIDDYRQAITVNTAALLKVHSSNFKLIGFTEAVELKELAELAKEFSLLVLDDVGSGCLLDVTGYGLDKEPMVQESIKDGASLTMFSGDKLLGGPQAGVLVGKKEVIDKIKRHPLARAFRIDKATLAGLQATLLHYIKGEAETKIPVWKMISMAPDKIEKRAGVWKERIGEVAEIVEGRSTVGGGSLPGSTLPTKLLAIRQSSDPSQGSDINKLVTRLRQSEPSVIARIEKDRLLFDPRTVLEEQDSLFIRILQQALSGD